MITRQCFNCQHLFTDRPSIACAAFPDGVPEDILTGEVSHHTPHDGDGGILYAPILPDPDVGEDVGLTEDERPS